MLLLGLGAMNLVFGDLNQDEGWYLYAARLIDEGQLPYQDFAFTQAPVLPFVYSVIQPLMERWGVAAGRLLSLALALATAFVAATLGRRLAPRGHGTFAFLMTWLLIAGCIYQSYFTTVVKTYSLCAFFMTFGFLALTSPGWVGAFGAGVLLVLAAGTRVSAGVLLPLVFACLLYRRRVFGNTAWMGFAVGAGLAAVLVFLPFLLVAPEATWFSLVQYHSSRSAGGFLPMLVFKAGFISRMVQAFFLPLALAVTLLILRWCGGLRPEKSADESPVPSLASLAWLSVAVVTAVHFSAPFPYEDYQCVIFPVFVAALSSAWVRAMAPVLPAERASPFVVGMLGVVLLLGVGSAFSSPINQDWFVRGRDRIWWRLKDRPDLMVLRQAGAWVRSHSKPSDLLLTQDTYLAVEAHRRVPRGLEMGPFSYYPEWSRKQAKQLHVLNRDMMRELLAAAPAPLAAFSGYGLSIRSPEISELPDVEQRALWSLVEQRYQEVLTVPHFGQAHTTLRLLERQAPQHR